MTSNIETDTHAFLLADLVAVGITHANAGDREATIGAIEAIDRVGEAIGGLDESGLHRIIVTMTALFGDVVAAVATETGTVDLARQALLNGPYSGGRLEQHEQTQEVRYIVTH